MALMEKKNIAADLMLLHEHYVEQCPLPIFEADETGVIINASNAFIDLVRPLSRETIIGQPAKFVMSLFGLNWISSPVHKALAGQGGAAAVCKTGGRILSIYSDCIRNSDARVARVMTIVQDMTELEKLRQDSFVLSREVNLHEPSFFEQVIECAPVAILVVDSKEKVMYCNAGYRQSFPELGTLVGEFASVITEKLGGDRELYCLRALAGEEIRGEHASLYGREWIIHALPLRNNQNDIIAGVVLLENVTELVRLQEEIRRLDRLNLIGEMAAGVAHEIRNPMTVVKGYLQYLGKKVPEDLKLQFDTVLLELGHIENIITDFLSLARSQPGTRERTTVNSVIQEVLPLIAAQAAKSNIEVIPELRDNPATQMLNKKEIKQVILNLVCNSIEAMPHSGHLTIRTGRREKITFFEVADTGSGIAQDKINKIFNPFFTTKNEGTGLGLAICENIVKNHGGKIEVASREGEGTTFTIFLPD